jgi:DNA-binding transcriptional MerR regulator
MEYEKLYYSISEVADRFNLKTSKLRYWESQFPHLLPKRKSTGARRYTALDIQKIEVLFDLIENKGLTLDGAKQALNSKGNPINPNQLIINQLTDIRHFLKSFSDQLE